MAKPANLVFAAEIERVALSQLEYASGIYRANLGDPVLEGRGTPCRPDEPVYFTPKENCRNCGASPETKHPHACGWCLTPR